MAKRTEPAQGEGAKKPIKLTVKQEKFAALVIAGATKSAAYRAAYNAGNMTDKQIWEEACKLAASPKVSQRIADATQRATEKAELTREWVIAKLMDNVEKAQSASDLTAANKALELLGKVDTLGLFVERKENTNTNRTISETPDEELERELAELKSQGTIADRAVEQTESKEVPGRVH